MNRFWNWMRETGKNYISSGRVNNVDFCLYKQQFEGDYSEIEIDCCGKILDKPLPKQILIGYMLEYLREKIKLHFIGKSNFSSSIGAYAFISIVKNLMTMGSEDVYGELEKVINDL